MFEGKNPNEIKIEKSQESESKIRSLVVGDDSLSRSLQKASIIFSSFDIELLPDFEKLSETVLEKNINMIILHHATGDTQNIIKAITKLRNNPEIKHQPLILLFASIFSSEPVRKKLFQAGVDIETGILLPDLLGAQKNLPEMLANLEDNYSNKTLINKQHFYKEYKEQLMQRSEYTADTERELEILNEVFKQNNAEEILDAGGGSGRLAIPLSNQGYDVTLLDASEDLIRKVKDEKIKIINGDIREMPVKDESFDAITYNWHIFCDILGNKAKLKVLKEAYRGLKKDGVLVFDIPDLDFFKAYEQLKEKMPEINPELATDPLIMKKRKQELEKYFQEEKDPMAKAIYKQGINALATLLDEELYLEQDIQDYADEKKAKEMEKYEKEKFSFKSDGLYYHDSGGENIFIGYVPKKDDMEKFLVEAGFSKGKISVRRWKTKSGFPKLTFIVKK